MLSQLPLDSLVLPDLNFNPEHYLWDGLATLTGLKHMRLCFAKLYDLADAIRLTSCRQLTSLQLGDTGSMHGQVVLHNKVCNDISLRSFMHPIQGATPWEQRIQNVFVTKWLCSAQCGIVVMPHHPDHGGKDYVLSVPCTWQSCC